MRDDLKGKRRRTSPKERRSSAFERSKKVYSEGEPSSRERRSSAFERSEKVYSEGEPSSRERRSSAFERSEKVNDGAIKMIHAEKVWRQLMTEFKIPQHKWRSEWKRIVEGYSGEKRVYHTLAHIGQVLRHIDRFGAKLLMPSAVRLAAIYHDVADTEEESADIAVSALKNLGLPDEFGAAVKAMVLCTKTHKPVDGLLAADSAIMSDCDLLILASPWPKYEQYTAKVRREWLQFDDAKFRAGRKEVMEKFIQRKPIYFTKEIHDKYEMVALANLKREIASL